MRRAEAADIKRFADCYPTALLYINSAARDTARLVELWDPSVPILLHVHELEYLLDVQGGPDLPRLLLRARRFIACSNAVRTNLIQRHGVEPQSVETVHESIAVRGVLARRGRGEIVRELGVPEDARLVVACGMVGWIKGTDLFLQLARLVGGLRDRVYFIWVGPRPEWSYREADHDVRVGRLLNVRFTGEVRGSADYLGAADVFVLPSREDSYPLVCLEAAAMGKPIVCFADAGGMPEFVEDDCGFVVPYLDIAAMADRVMGLLDSPECRSKLGEAARRKVKERHDVSVAAPRVMEIMERTIAGG